MHIADFIVESRHDAVDFVFMVCSNYKSMSKKTSETVYYVLYQPINIVVKCAYNLTASSSFYLWYSWSLAQLLHILE